MAILRISSTDVMIFCNTFCSNAIWSKFSTKSEYRVTLHQANHEAPFRPNSNLKTGIDCYCGYIDEDGEFRQFPKWRPDPVPQPRKRKIVSDTDKDKEPWKVGAPEIIQTPNPPVQMLARNLRQEFPKSFARPTI